MAKEKCECESKKGKKEKRAISGYNCYMKECAKSKAFQECLTERGWAKLSEPDKTKYNNMASNGCNL